MNANAPKPAPVSFRKSRREIFCLIV
jgi:hypothetical protein